MEVAEASSLIANLKQLNEQGLYSSAELLVPMLLAISHVTTTTHALAG